MAEENQYLKSDLLKSLFLSLGAVVIIFLIYFWQYKH